MDSNEYKNCSTDTAQKKKIFEFLMSCKVELKVMGCPLLNQHKCGYCVSKINNVKNFSLMVRHIIYILKVRITYIILERTIDI